MLMKGWLIRLFYPAIFNASGHTRYQPCGLEVSTMSTFGFVDDIVVLMMKTVISFVYYLSRCPVLSDVSRMYI